MRREPDPDVAVAIELASMCQAFNALPSAVMQEDPLILQAVNEVLLARQEKADAEDRNRRQVSGL